jgi:hypothetical protein
MLNFFCNNRGLLNTHEKKIKIQGIYNLYFLKITEIFGLFDIHEYFMTCKCGAM